MGGNIDVHDGDDRREGEDEDEVPQGFVAERAGPSTDQVTIVGAEVAGEATALVPIVSQADAPPEPAGDDSTEVAVRLTNEPSDPGTIGHTVQPLLPGETAVPAGTPSPPKLPHWTEAPTGQVPAVLSRETGEGGGGSHGGIAAPTWREGHSDWVAHEEEFEPAMFGDDEAALGSLDETDRTDVDRRPWEFDLPSSGAPVVGGSRGAGTPKRGPSRGADADHAAGAHDLTTQIPVVPPRSSWSDEPVSSEGAGGSGSGAGSRDEGHDRALPSSRTTEGLDGPDYGDELDEPDEPVDDLPGLQRTRPTGTARIGRVRKGGMRSSRIRAKRPEDIDALTDTPLAAEPPGASVTAVPGAGRRRGGMAGLAAADSASDRSAGRADKRQRGESEAASATEAAAATAAATATEAATDVATRHTDASDRHTDADADTEAGGIHDDAGADIDADQNQTDGPLGGGPPPPRRLRLRPEAGENGDTQVERRGGESSIRVRVATGVVAAAVGLIVFKLGTAPALALSTVVVTFAAGECFGVLRRAGYHPATLLGLVGTVSLMVAAYIKGPSAIPLVLVLIAIFTLLWYLFGIERGSPIAGSAATLFTIGWISLLGSYAGLLLSPSEFPHREGIAFLLGAVIATVANDVGALVIGRWIGRHALAPNVSPHKTWEGWLGGAVFSVAISAAGVGAIHPWTPAHAALLGLVVAVVAPIGDLCESLLKRDFRIKDMGSLLPGHGGVLDRVDALLFVLPATYYLVRALNIA
jgi:phosphatidate cytidylyltransferase